MGFLYFNTMGYTLLQTLLTVPNVVAGTTVLSAFVGIGFAISGNINKKLKTKADKESTDNRFSAIEKGMDKKADAALVKNMAVQINHMYEVIINKKQ